MMVPDYALIGEIMFFAYGFEFAKECGAKMVTTFKLCSEQLSAQPHYDYGRYYSLSLTHSLIHASVLAQYYP